MSQLMRLNPFDLDTVFDNFWAPSRLSEKGFFSPRVDIKEQEHNYLITAELPGTRKEDIHVDLHNGVLSLSAEVKQEEKEEKEGKVIRQERRYGHFQRSFTVGDGITPGDIKAGFENGLLTLTVPKAQPVEQEKQKIPIG